MVQGELFLDEQNSSRNQTTPSFFSRNQLALSLDKIVLLLITSLVLFVLTYSFGYERGKRTAERELQTFTAHIETLPTAQPSPESQAMAVAHTETESKEAPLANGTNVGGSLKHANIDSVPQSVKPTVSVVSSALEQAASQSHKKYTIQVATVLKREQAEREVAKLLSVKLGDSFFVESGKYFVVCVGGFETVASAKPLLSAFKTKGPYFDAFVRSTPNT